MKKTTGSQFLLLALCAFSGLGIELIYAFLLEPMIYHAQMREWTAIQNIIHWIVTCITWSVIAVMLVKKSKQEYGFDLFASKGNMKTWQWVSIIACAMIMIVISSVSWNGLKVVKEFQSNGWLKFIFQYIYYIVETALITLIIVFGQKAFEHWFKRDNFPYGGIVVAVTWGLMHCLTRGSLTSGLLSAISGFLFGVVYLLTNKDIRKTYPILVIMFIM